VSRQISLLQLDADIYRRGRSWRSSGERAKVEPGLVPIADVLEVLAVLTLELNEPRVDLSGVSLERARDLVDEALQCELAPLLLDEDDAVLGMPATSVDKSVSGVYVLPVLATVSRSSIAIERTNSASSSRRYGHLAIDALASTSTIFFSGHEHDLLLCWLAENSAAAFAATSLRI
jgi:hypothetical protein